MDANVGRIADTSVGWVDPHRRSAVSERAGRQWRIGLRGDIGGFGAGSELAWYVNAFASRRLTDRLALTLGYRVWDFDREGDEDILEFDATLAGGGIGLTFRFCANDLIELTVAKERLHASKDGMRNVAESPGSRPAQQPHRDEQLGHTTATSANEIYSEPDYSSELYRRNYTEPSNNC